MDILKATKDFFQSVRELDAWKRVEFSSVVIVPTDQLHDSGFRQMEFVLMDKDDNPIGKIGGFVDSIYVEPHYTSKGIGRCVHMDLLPCGLMRFWVNETMFIENCAGSDLDVFYIEEKAKGW